MWSSVNKVETLRVKGPFYKFHDPFLVELTGWVKEMLPDNIQRTRPDGGAPVMQNISTLEMNESLHT